MVGIVDLEERQQVDRIGRQRNAKNKGEAMLMPLLHEALVEVHKEYERVSRAAKIWLNYTRKQRRVGSIK